MKKIDAGIERSPIDIPPPDRIVKRYPGDQRGSPQWLKSTLDRYADSYAQHAGQQGTTEEEPSP